MKKVLIFWGIIFNSMGLFSQPENNNGIKKIEVFCVEWDAKTKYPFTIKNFQEHYTYTFTIRENDLEFFFLDYNDCKQKLSSQKLLDSTERVSTKINAMVTLTLKWGKKVNIFFDTSGNYNFQNQWHVINPGFYYIIFKYLSNEIVSEKSLRIAKQSLIDEDIWHGEK